MKDVLERMVIEQAELVTKIDKLKAFIASDKALLIEATDRNLLLQQYGAMKDYNTILKMRIRILEKKIS